MKFITGKILKKVYPERRTDAHKGDFGRVIIIGGSAMYTGAPVLAARAALAAGCDLVYIAAPQRAANIAAKMPDLITYPLNCEIMTTKHFNKIMLLAKDKDAVLIGNGIGRNKKTLLFAKKFIMACEKPMVIDADALHALRNYGGNKETIYTPHAGEFHALTGTKPSDSIEKRRRQVKAAAQKLKGTVLLKGHEDVISDGKKTYINKTGNPYMTKGGTGDVLAGVAVSLLAQLAKQPYTSDTALTAACAAAYINGKAGDAVAKRKKQALLASDLIDEVPRVIKSA